MRLYHGDDQISSRQALLQEIDNEKNKGSEVVSLDGRKASPEEIIQALESGSLFGGNRLVVIEGFFSQPTSKRTEIIDKYLAKTKPSNLIIWESKKIPKLKLGKLPLETREFPLPQILFTFLDSLRPGNCAQSLKMLSQLVKTTPWELVFFMIARQIRLLIIQSETKANNNWQAQKLGKQATFFGLPKLIDLHKKLFLIDLEIKTGQSLRSLPEALTDFILLV